MFLAPPGTTQRKQEIIYHLRRLIRDKEIADIKKRAELMHAARGGFWSLELALNKARGDWGLVVDLNEALAVELTVSLEDGTRGEPQAHTHSHKILGMGLLLTAAVKLGKVDILDHILGAIKVGRMCTGAVVRFNSQCDVFCHNRSWFSIVMKVIPGRTLVRPYITLRHVISIAVGGSHGEEAGGKYKKRDMESNPHQHVPTAYKKLRAKNSRTSLCTEC